jgi:hypothetical protein
MIISFLTTATDDMDDDTFSKHFDLPWFMMMLKLFSTSLNYPQLRG